MAYPSQGQDRTDTGVTKTIATPLSALAENFIPRKTSRKLSTSSVPTDNELDRSLSRTGPGKIENPHDSIEMDIAMIGAAYPTEKDKPMTMADVAGAGGPAATGAGGPAGIRACGPVVARTRFLAVAEVYSPVREVEGDPPTDNRKIEQDVSTPEEEVGSHPLEQSGVEKWVRPRDGSTEIDFMAPEEDVGFHPLEHAGVKKWVRARDGSTKIDFMAPEEDVSSHPLEHSGVEKWAGTSNGSLEISPLDDPGGITKSDPIHKLVGWEPLERPVQSVTLCWDNEPAIDDVQEEPEEGEAIVVGAVGSAAPWFLTGWTNDVEVEFMIDTGCQVTILATSVFEKMCAADPQVRCKIRPCGRRLVSADSSPLTVIGELELEVVFPGLRCTMCCVVASIGSDGLLGTEALQSCLPHQLDLRTGQLWAEGRATLQLHQQKPTPDINGLLLTAVVLPPDSEVAAPFALNGGQLGTCGLIEPNWDFTEEFGVVVGHPDYQP